MVGQGGAGLDAEKNHRDLCGGRISRGLLRRGPPNSAPGAAGADGGVRAPAAGTPDSAADSAMTEGPAGKADDRTDGSDPAGADEPAEEPAEPVVLAYHLEIPWSIEKYGDTFYLTERTGSIVRIGNGTVERQRVELAKRLSSAAEAGLLGFVLAPDFGESNRAYAYYTYQEGSGPLNRIVTLRLEGEVWKEESVLVDRIPSGRVHHGGRLKIGPDGKLYATTGDAAEANLAQDLHALSGKILRLNPDGSIPGDNPFPDSYIYTYGHRNPQGLAWAPDGTMYASEHGNRANDEINVIEAGLNYGWPVIEGPGSGKAMSRPCLPPGGTPPGPRPAWLTWTASCTWRRSGDRRCWNSIRPPALGGKSSPATAASGTCASRAGTSISSRTTRTAAATRGPATTSCTGCRCRCWHDNRQKCLLPAA